MSKVMSHDVAILFYSDNLYLIEEMCFLNVYCVVLGLVSIKMNCDSSLYKMGVTRNYRWINKLTKLAGLLQ